MRWAISSGGWMSWFLGRRNSSPITTVVRRQTRALVCLVRGSELVAMVHPSGKVTKVKTGQQPGSLRDQPSRSSHAGHHGLEVATPRANRGYARGICEGIAVRAGELSLCVRRICVVSAGGAYALALLAIDALGESVSLSDKTRRCCHTEKTGEQS